LAEHIEFVAGALCKRSIVVSADRSFPGLFPLVGIHLPLAGAAFDQGV
jgi:hypothetical protein